MSGGGSVPGVVVLTPVDATVVVDPGLTVDGVDDLGGVVGVDPVPSTLPAESLV